MKRTVSIFLAMLLIATLFASFGTVSAVAAKSKKITSTNPVITANVGEKISLYDYSVVFDGDSDAVSEIKWAKEDGAWITEITPDKKGVTKLIVSSRTKTTNVYVVAKEKNETEYVLFEDDFSKYSSVNDLRSNGYVLPQSASLSDGALVFGDIGDGYARVILPEWLGDFGDYSISADVKMLESKDTGRWFGLVYRIQNQNGKYFPYYHMCVRENTTVSNGIEFAERTTQDGWNVATTSGGEVTSMKNAFYKVKVTAFEKTVEQSINDDVAIFVNETVLGKTTALYTKGMIGLTMNYGKVAVKGVKVTVQTSAPVQQVRTLDLINNAHDELNLINQMANVQKVEGSKALDVLSGDNIPGSIMVNVSEVDDINAVVNKCVEKQVLPTFRVDNNEVAQTLINALKNASLKDANVISADTKVLAKIRAFLNTIRTGLIIDIDGTLTEKTANDLRISIRQAPATFCVINVEDASHVNVDELQEMAVAVWVDVEAKSDSAEFTVDALRAVTAGANGVITDSSAKLTEVVNSNLLEKTLTRTPVMIGHRGNPGVAPENTLSGFIKAYENGADVFEIDVEITKDGEIIIMHDNTINRTTTYSGNKTIGQMTLEEIKAEFILGKNGQATTEKVPTLKELLEEFKDKDCKIFVEFKGSNSQNILKTCQLLKEYDMVHKVDVISFNTSFLSLTTAKNNIPGMSTGYLHSVSGGSATVEDALESLYSSLKTAQTFKSSINPAKGIITSTFLQATTDRGMTVWPWTYNVSSNNVGFLSGCDGVTTDDMQWVTNMVKYLTVAENTEIEVGGTAEAGVKSVAYGNKESVINGENLIVKVLAGEDVVKIENGTVTGVKAGTATVLYGYKAKTTNGSPYVVYAQPATVTVTAGASSDDNNSDVSVNNESSAPVDGEEESFALIIIVVIVAAVAAGVAAFFVVKKKKQ
jgi:glycerophosphoryl diester phosphodiesterase